MKRSVVVALIILSVGIFLSAQVGAEETLAAKPYSGDFWSRSTLTGDWGGTRNEWAAKGVMNSRPNDAFGIGYYYMDISNPKLTGIFKDRELRYLKSEQERIRHSDSPWSQASDDFLMPTRISYK